MTTELRKRYTLLSDAVYVEIMKDLARFELLEGKWSELDGKTLQQIGEYFQFHGKNVKLHNHASSEHFMPVFTKRIPELVELADELQKEHKEIDASIDNINGLFERAERGPLEKKLAAYAQFLRQHMEKHGQDLAYVWTETIDPDIQIAAEKEFFQELSKDEEQINAAWMADGMSDDERKEYLASLPFWQRLAFNMRLKPQFQKKVKVFERFGGGRDVEEILF